MRQAAIKRPRSFKVLSVRSQAGKTTEHDIGFIQLANVLSRDLFVFQECPARANETFGARGECDQFPTERRQCWGLRHSFPEGDKRVISTRGTSSSKSLPPWRVIFPSADTRWPEVTPKEECGGGTRLAPLLHHLECIGHQLFGVISQECWKIH